MCSSLTRSSAFVCVCVCVALFRARKRVAELFVVSLLIVEGECMTLFFSFSSFIFELYRLQQMLLRILEGERFF